MNPKTTSNLPRAIVIDGNSLLYRNYYATESQAKWALAKGVQPMNAVLAMVRACQTLQEMDHYDYNLIAFDHWKKNFRHEQFAEYKAGRAKMPDPLVSQLKIVNEALTYLGYNVQSLPTFEGDDLVGSFCHLMNKAGVAVTVYTSDHDLLQLVSPLTEVCIIQKGVQGTYYTDDNFLELNMGLSPAQIPDYKGLAGDSSDHLPGVPGIGPKTGVELLNQYGSLEQIYEHLAEIKPNITKKLTVGQASAQMCKQLATIRRDLFVDADPMSYAIHEPDWAGLENLLERYGVKNARITRSTNRH